MNNEGQVGKKQETKAKKAFFKGVVTTCTGDRIAPVYKSVFDKDVGVNLVKQVDTFDLFEFIQASAGSTDLALLQKRFIELGEIPAVDPTLGSNDLTKMPSNIHEVYDMANDIASNFAKLPKSVQDVFGTKEAYMKALLDGTYQATLVNYINEANKAANKEEKPQEKEGN